MRPVDGAHPWERAAPPVGLAFDSAEQVQPAVWVVGGDMIARVHLGEEPWHLCLPHSAAARLRRWKRTVEELRHRVVVGRWRDRPRLVPSDGNDRVGPEVVDECGVLSCPHESDSGMLCHCGGARGRGCTGRSLGKQRPVPLTPWGMLAPSVRKRVCALATSIPHGVKLPLLLKQICGIF